MNVSCYDNRMIQQLINLFSCCFSCMRDTSSNAVLSEQAYGELETQPYTEAFTHVTD